MTRQENISVQHKSTINQYAVHWNDYVRELKEGMCKNEGVFSDATDLVFKWRRLGDDVQWWETDVLNNDNSVLHLYKR